MQPGDVLLMMSDGIPDAHNAAGETYDTPRLLAALKQRAASNADDVVETVLADVKRWTGDTPLFDDLTLVALSLDADQDLEGDHPS